MTNMNPMSEYLLKLQLIVTNTEFKNRFEANKYETLQSHHDGDMYVRACEKTDIFESYEYAVSSLKHNKDRQIHCVVLL